MTDRDRLIELFEEWDKQDEVDNLADYLIANGVTVTYSNVGCKNGWEGERMKPTAEVVYTEE